MIHIQYVFHLLVYPIHFVYSYFVIRTKQQQPHLYLLPTQSQETINNTVIFIKQIF